MGSNSSFIVLAGPSGTGKSSILHYMESMLGAQSTPKYTTRQSRGTPEDAHDFMFCTRDTFPTEGVLQFESYGDLFGVPLAPIDKSVHDGTLHALIIGDHVTIRELAARYGERMITVFVFCESKVLRERIFADPASQRVGRWALIQQELANIYDQLAGVRYVVDNSGSLEHGCQQMRDIVASCSAGSG